MCLAWIQYCSMLCCSYWSHRFHLPHLVPSRRSQLFRNLGRSLARLQQSSYGLYLVWCSSLDRGRMCQAYDLCDLALVPEGSQRNSKLGHQHCGFCLVFHFLAMLSASDLVPSPQDSPLVHCEGLCRSHCRNCVLHLGHRQSSRYWPNCASAKH